VSVMLPRRQDVDKSPRQLRRDRRQMKVEG